LTLGAYLFISCRKLVQIHIGKILNVDHLVLGLIDGVDELIQFQVDGPRVPVLGVLDQERGEIDINDQDKNKSTGVLYPAAQLIINSDGELQIELRKNPWRLSNIIVRGKGAE